MASNTTPPPLLPSLPNVRVVFMSMDENGNSTIYPPSANPQFLFGMNAMNGMGGFGNSSFPFSFQDFLDHLARTHEPRGTPPTSKAFRSSLPEVVIDSKLVEEKAECAICKDAFEIQQKAVKLPCNHLYHNECIEKWLEMHSTCPVCRFQLPTEPDQQSSTMDSNSASPPTQTEFEAPPTAHSFPQTDSPNFEATGEQEYEEDDEYEEALCEFEIMRREDCPLVNGEGQMVSLTCGCSYHTECLESFLRISGHLSPGQNLSETSTFRCPSCKLDVSIVQPLAVD